MKKRNKWLAGSAVLFVLILLLAISFINMQEAQAFTDSYTTTGENALQFPVKQKKASSSATVKYETVSWYLFKEELGGTDTGYLDATARDWSEEAFKVETTRVNRTDPDSAGIFWDTMQMDAASFVSELEKLYSRSELINGVTMYASRTLQKVDGSGNKLGGPYYNYNDFCDATNWSSATLDAVRNGYNIEIFIQLSAANFNVRFVEIDENGNESEISQPEGFSFSGATADGENAGSEVIYGEKLSFGTASYTGKNYKYKGYQWTSMRGSSVTAGSPGSITVSNSYAPNGTLELTFYFEKQPEPTQPPFTTPVVTKPPTETPTPTPEPTATPAPTSQPPESVYYDYMYTRYFTTDAGHWIGEVADSTTYTVVSGTSVTGGGAVSTNAYTKRENSYLVGTDSSGNTWYFIADGTNATYVHPAKYNGHAVESASVKYITELVFPSAITHGGSTYTVTHIGGGTAKYKTEQSEYTDTEDISYHISYGTYEYAYSQEGSSTSNYKSREYEYIYGVLGNGQIYSDAMDSTFYETTGAYDETWYVNCYYVYNTTLKKITIPSTVKEIENYAFYNCRALETIEGGAGLTTIRPHAFEVAREAAPQLSSTWTVGSRTCYDYIYYNLEYSMTTVTGTMAAWQTSSRLSSEFVFPYLPALTTIYYQAFKNHYNIDDVDLPETISTIAQEAFMGCELENIRIPNAACSIYDAAGSKGYYSTLGSKGQVENPTAIHTVPDSTALSYGLKYDGYYTLYCGYPVNYKPNGGTPEEGYEIYSKLNIQYFYPETDKVYGYSNYKPYSHDQYSYYSAGYQYCSYLAPDGVLWRPDTLNTTATVVSSGTTFTELINVDGVAHYALDSAGNVWFSGQTLDLDVDSGGSWYTLYSDMCGWEKLTFPAGTVEVKYEKLGIFALDGTGIVWWCDPSWTTNKWVQLNPSGPYFVSFAVDTYQGDTTIENNCMMYGVDSSGVVWRTYADSSLGFYLYSSLDSEDFKKYTSISVTAGEISYMNGSAGYLACIDTSGGLYLYNGSKSISFTGYNFVEMEPLGVSTNAVKVKDASGNTYVAWAYRSSSGNLTGKLYKAASSGVDIKQAWYGTMSYTNYTDSGMNSGDSDSTYSDEHIYVWTTDGYLTACSTSTSWKPASVKFSSVEYIYGNIYAIAEDGTLWSMGNNKYGQLGNPNQSGSFGYDYPSNNASHYLTQTGTGAYQAVYSDSNEYTLALGTDGSVYFAGDPTYCDIMYGEDPVNEFVLSTEQEWPGSTVITRYIMGYDYDTEIAGTLFKRSGYEFNSWNTAADGTGTACQPGDMVELSAALTLYAQWGAKGKYIIFHPNGGSGYMPAMTFEYSVTSATLMENAFTRSGYEFTGWNTAEDGSDTSVADKATVTVTGDVLHLYAQWKKKTISYTLVYMTYPFGSQTNTAWKTKSLAYEQTETVEGAPYTVSGTYTVGYNLNKPSGMSTTPTMDTLTSANTSTIAPSFDSWELYKQVGSDLVYRGREYIPGATITKLTQTSGDTFYLYPSWGGANASVLLPEASCEGYDFLGWSETSSGITKIYPVYGEESDEVSVYTPVKNTTLYAIWKPKQYTVNLDGQNATTHTQTSVTMTFDAACPVVTVPTRDQYVFQGYYTGTEGSGTQYYKADGTSSQTWRISDGTVTTLYAQWRKNRKDIDKAEISIFSIDPAYIVNANLKEDPELPALEWREYGDTMLEISVKTIGCFDYAVLKAPWESQERIFYWDEGTYSEEDETWAKNENIVFWRSQLRYPEEEDKVRNYPGYNNQTYTITIAFYIDDQVVIEYKVGLYMVSWLVWREEIHPSREGGSWDFNGDGIPDKWPFENGK